MSENKKIIVQDNENSVENEDITEQTNEDLNDSDEQTDKEESDDEDIDDPENNELNNEDDGEILGDDDEDNDEIEDNENMETEGDDDDDEDEEDDFNKMLESANNKTSATIEDILGDDVVDNDDDNNEEENKVDGDGDDEDDYDDDDYDDEENYKKIEENIEEDTLSYYHPFNKKINNSELASLINVVRNKQNIIIDPLHRTLPILTKYEKARILGVRAKQLNKGAEPYVKISDDIIDAFVIANKELKEKKLPFIIQRPLPNGNSEYWKLEDLEIY